MWTVTDEWNEHLSGKWYISILFCLITVSLYFVLFRLQNCKVLHFQFIIWSYRISSFFFSFLDFLFPCFSSLSFLSWSLRMINAHLRISQKKKKWLGKLKRKKNNQTAHTDEIKHIPKMFGLCAFEQRTTNTTTLRISSKFSRKKRPSNKWMALCSH